MPNWKNHPYTYKGHLFLLNPDVVFQAQVDVKTATDGDVHLGLVSGNQLWWFVFFKNITSGIRQNIVRGQTMTIGTTPLGDDLGRAQVFVQSSLDGVEGIRVWASPGIKDGELTPNTDAYITVYDDFRVWMQPPRALDDGSLLKKGGFQQYTRNTPPPPVANAGVGYAGFVDSVTDEITVSFDGTGSFAVALGATISTYLWDIDDGSFDVGTSASSAITATFPIGFRWVWLTVTDSNGEDHFCRVPVFAAGESASVGARVSTAGAAFDSSTVIGVQTADKAFDNNNTTYWGATVDTGWVSAALTAAASIKGYSVVSTTTAAPQAWTVEEWRGLAGWVIIDTQTGQTGWGSAETRSFTLAEVVTGTTFRINITANNGLASVRVYELNLLAATSVVSELPIERFEVTSQRHTSAGQRMSFKVLEDLSAYPDGTLALYWEDEIYPEAWHSFSANTDNAAAIHVNGELVTSSDFTGGGHAWSAATELVDVGTVGNVDGWIVDRRSPGYIGQGTEINGWLTTEGSGAAGFLYRVEDLFGTPIVTQLLQFEHSGTSQRNLKTSAVNPGWAIICTHYDAEGTFVVIRHPQTGAWSSEIEVTDKIETDTDFENWAGIWMSRETDALCRVGAYKTSGAGAAVVPALYESPDYGFTWAENTTYVIDLGDGLGQEFAEIFGDDDSMWYTKKTITGGTTQTQHLRKTDGVTDTDFGLLLVGRNFGRSEPMYGIHAAPTNADNAVFCLRDDLDGGSVERITRITRDGGTTTFVRDFPGITTGTQYLRGIISYDDDEFVYVWGRSGTIAYRPDFDPGLSLVTRDTGIASTVIGLVEGVPAGVVGPSSTQSLAGPDGREHMKFIGWEDVDPTGMRATDADTSAETVLDCIDVGGRLAKVAGFPQIVRRDAAPGNFDEMDDLNVDRFIWYLLYWHSTALELSDFQWSGTLDTYAYPMLTSQGASLWQQGSIAAQTIGYMLTCDKRGRLWVKLDPQLVDAGSRTSTVQAILETSDWEKIRYTQQRPPRVYWLWGSAVDVSTKDADDGTWTPTAFFSLSPGEAPGQGVSESAKGEQIGIDQTELNTREGHRYAVRLNPEQSFFDVELPHAGDADIDPALMEWVTLTIDADTAAQRGLTFTNGRFLPFEVNTRHDHAAGTKTITLRIEREAFGKLAQTYTPPGGE